MLRAALLPWSLVPERPDVAHAAEEWLSLAQAALGSEPGLAWVERAELGRLLTEQELAASGLGEPRQCLRLGKLAGAQLLVTGRVDVSNPAGSAVSFEAIDARRGDLLAERTVKFAKRAHRLFKPAAETGEEVVAAVRSLVQEATMRLRSLERKPSVALLFLANRGSSTRLDARAARLLEQLGTNLENSGARLLRFPRTTEAGAEQELAVLALADGADAGWRGVADLHVWGTYLEHPRDGVAFDDTEAEVELSACHGAEGIQTCSWRGTVARLPDAAVQLGAELSRLLARPEDRVEPALPEETARRLVGQARELEQGNLVALQSTDFDASEAGRNFHRQHLGLLQTAVFFAPSSPEARVAYAEARWDTRRSPLWKRSVPELWRTLDDLAVLGSLGLGCEPLLRGASGKDAQPDIVRLDVLAVLLGKLADGCASGERSVDELRRAGDVWARIVLEQAPREADTPARAGRRRAVAGHAVRQLCPRNHLGGVIGPDVLGAEVIVRMVEKSWPVLSIDLRREICKAGFGTQGVYEALIFGLFERVGRSDTGLRLLGEVLTGLPPSDKGAGRLRAYLLEQVAALALPIAPAASQSVGTTGDSLSATLRFQVPDANGLGQREQHEKRIRDRLSATVPELLQLDIMFEAASASAPPPPRPSAPRLSSAVGLGNNAPRGPLNVRALQQAVDELRLPLKELRSGSTFSNGKSGYELHYEADPMATEEGLRTLEAKIIAHLRQRFSGLAGAELLVTCVRAAVPARGAPDARFSAQPTGLSVDFLPPKLATVGRVLTLTVADPFGGDWSPGPARPEFAAISKPELEATRALACVGGYLWVDGHPISYALAGDGAEFGLAARSLITGDVEPLSAAARVSSRAVAAAEAGGSLYVATAFDGLVRFAPDRIEHLGPEQGAPSLRLSSVAAGPDCLVVAAAPPEMSIGKLDTRTMRWSSITPPRDAAGKEPARLATCGRWLLHSAERLALYDLQAGVWWPVPADASARDGLGWLAQPATSIVGDGTRFWIAGEHGLVSWAPEKDPRSARRVLDEPISCIADAGDRVLVLLKAEVLPAASDASSGTPTALATGAALRTRLLLLEKADGRRGAEWVFPAKLTRVVAAGDRAYVSGARLIEVALGAVVAAPPPIEPACLGGVLPSQEAHRAALAGDVELLRRLLRQEHTLFQSRPGRRSPLHTAAEAGRLDVVRVLLDGGVALDALSADGLTPLALAAGRGQVDVVRLLLARGADVHATARPLRASSYPPPNAGLRETSGPLPSVGSVTAILRADGRAELSWSAVEGAHDALEVHRRDVAERLSYSMSGIIPHTRGGVLPQLGEQIALLGPSETSYVDVVPMRPNATYEYRIIPVGPTERRLERQVPVSAQVTASAPSLAETAILPGPLEALFQTALHRAAAEGFPECIELLLEAGGDPLALDNTGLTPLMRAVLRGQNDAARLLATRTRSLHAPLPTVTSARRRLLPNVAGRETSVQALWTHRVNDALQAAYLGFVEPATFEVLLAEAVRQAPSIVGDLAGLAALRNRPEDALRFLDLTGNDERAALKVIKARPTLCAEILRRFPPEHRFPARCSDLVCDLLEYDAKFPDPSVLPLLVEKTTPLSGLQLDQVASAIMARAEPEKWHRPNKADLLRLLADNGARFDSLAPVIADRILAQLASAEATSGAGPSSAPTTARPSGEPSPVPGARRGTEGALLIGQVSIPLAGFAATQQRYRYAPIGHDRGRRGEAVDDGGRALLAAAAKGDEATVVACLARGVPIDVEDEEGYSPLMLAIREDKMSTTQLLVDRGANLNHTTPAGISVIGATQKASNVALLRELLDLGANPNISGLGEVSGCPLVYAMRHNEEMMELLLKAGADPRMPRGDGGWIPPIFYAAETGNLALVRRLEQAGADPRHVVWLFSSEGVARPYTALLMAARSKSVEMVRYFINLGQDPMITEADGSTLLDVAERNNAPDVAAYLRDLGVKPGRVRPSLR